MLTTSWWCRLKDVLSICEMNKHYKSNICAIISDIRQHNPSSELQPANSLVSYVKAVPPDAARTPSPAGP